MDLNNYVQELSRQKDQIEKRISLLTGVQLSDQIKFYLIGDQNYRALAQNDSRVNEAYREAIGVLFNQIYDVLGLESLKKHLVFKENRNASYPLGRITLDYSEIVDSSTILYKKEKTNSVSQNSNLNVEDLFGSTVFFNYASFMKSIYLVQTANSQSKDRAYRIAKQNRDLWEFLGNYNDDTLSLTKEDFTNALIKLTVAFKQTANDLCEYLGIKDDILSDPSKVATRLYRPWRTGSLQSHPIVITHRLNAQRAFSSYQALAERSSTPKEEYQNLPQELTKFFEYLNKMGLMIQFQYTKYTDGDNERFFANSLDDYKDPNNQPQDDSLSDYNQLIQELLKKE